MFQSLTILVSRVTGALGTSFWLTPITVIFQTRNQTPCFPDRRQLLWQRAGSLRVRGAAAGGAPQPLGTPRSQLAADLLHQVGFLTQSSGYLIDPAELDVLHC